MEAADSTAAKVATLAKLIVVVDVRQVFSEWMNVLEITASSLQSVTISFSTLWALCRTCR